MVNILKAVMATGFGFMVVTGTTILLCVPAFPLIPAACTVAPLSVLEAFSQAGVIPYFLTFSMAGPIVFYITGKWKNN